MEERSDGVVEWWSNGRRSQRLRGDSCQPLHRPTPPSQTNTPIFRYSNTPLLPFARRPPSVYGVPLNSMEPLTGRQQKVLDFIRKHHRKTGSPPTTRETQPQSGVPAQTAPSNHPLPLERK